MKHHINAKAIMDRFDRMPDGTRVKWDTDGALGTVTGSAQKYIAWDDGQITHLCDVWALQHVQEAR